MKNNICAFFIICILTACQSRQALNVNTSISSATNSSGSSLTQKHCEDYGYCYLVPGFLESARGENGITVFSPPNNFKGSNYYIQPYHSSNESKPCSPEQVGIYPTSVIKSDSGGIISIRGKADYAEVMKGDYDHTHEPTCKGGYAFCSQHAGKQVTICISQQTDNLKLANEIFDSFKWTK